jgi:hypothetical protein
MPQRPPPTKRQSDFRLPPGASMQKDHLPSGWAYVFRHTELGLLGRLVLHGRLPLRIGEISYARLYFLC